MESVYVEYPGCESIGIKPISKKNFNFFNTHFVEFTSIEFVVTNEEHEITRNIYLLYRPKSVHLGKETKLSKRDKEVLINMYIESVYNLTGIKFTNK